MVGDVAFRGSIVVVISRLSVVSYSLRRESSLISGFTALRKHIF
jgi:hypothetical protein